MPATKTLKTRTSPWSAVFRACVAKLESDPTFRRVVGDGLRSWSGSAGDAAPMVPSTNRPVVRLTPQPSDISWYFADAQAGDLLVAVEIAVQSLCIDAITDLWDLIYIALRPCQPEFTAVLVQAGAETGEIVFSDPAFDASPDASPEGIFLGRGAFRLKVVRPD